MQNFDNNYPDNMDFEDIDFENIEDIDFDSIEDIDFENIEEFDYENTETTNKNNYEDVDFEEINVEESNSDDYYEKLKRSYDINNDEKEESEYNYTSDYDFDEDYIQDNNSVNDNYDNINNYENDNDEHNDSYEASNYYNIDRKSTIHTYKESEDEELEDEKSEESFYSDMEVIDTSYMNEDLEEDDVKKSVSPYENSEYKTNLQDIIDMQNKAKQIDENDVIKEEKETKEDIQKDIVAEKDKVEEKKEEKKEEKNKKEKKSSKQKKDKNKKNIDKIDKTKKKSKSKVKIVLVVLCVICIFGGGSLVLAKMNIINVPILNTVADKSINKIKALTVGNNKKNKAKEGKQKEKKVIKYTKGKIDNNVYVNEWSGMKLSLPKGFHNMSEEFYQTYNTDTTECGLYLTDDKGDYIVNIFSDMVDTENDVKTFLYNKSAQLLESNGIYKYKVASENTAVIAGKEHYALHYIGNANGVTLGQSYYGCQIGDKISTIIITFVNGNAANNDKYANLFIENK